MRSPRLNLQRIAHALKEHCPFIQFAIIGTDETGLIKCQANPQLSVFIDQGTNMLQALEHILPVLDKHGVNDVFTVTLLNRMDPRTRLEAIQGHCLFIREGHEQFYRSFRQKARLDHSIMRAHGRKMGIIDND
jgi:hypothetical protein